MIENIDTSLIDWSRAQFALTAMYHWLFVPLTLGLGVIQAIMETIYYRTGNEAPNFGWNYSVSISLSVSLRDWSSSSSSEPTGLTIVGLSGISSGHLWLSREFSPSLWKLPLSLLCFLVGTRLANAFISPPLGWRLSALLFPLSGSWSLTHGCNIRSVCISIRIRSVTRCSISGP